MEAFLQFIEQCKSDLNQHQQNVKETFEIWKALFSKFRESGELPHEGNTKNIRLRGLNEYSLTDEEAFFIVGHTASYSKWINQPLRDGNKFDNSCKEYFANSLGKALDKLPIFNSQKVYRMDSPLGEKNQVMHWFEKNNKKIVQTPYFLSTSKNNWNNTDITWHITTMKTNSNARDLFLITNNATEKEVLFKRNSFFKITKVNCDEGIIEMNEVNRAASFITLIGFYFEK